MIESLYRHLLIPAFESGWQRRGTFRILKDLEASQWLSADHHRKRQATSLKKLLLHATNNCPYYREKWGQLGLDPQSITSTFDLQSWPVIGRETILQNRFQMRSEQEGLALISKATGGSSGVPLQFDLDHASNDHKMAAWHRGYAWAGAGLGTKQFYLWGAAMGKLSRRQRWKDSLYHAIYRRKVVNCFGLTDERVPWYLDKINQHRPDTIVAYTNPIYFLARALEEQGLKPWSPKSIVVGAEKLHDFQREQIERVFQAPVFETYGSREFTLIGGECAEHAGFHLTMENLLVEILDDDGQTTPAGSEGNLVITDLTNYGMPFIRYANGDRAIAGESSCPCGRGLPLLGKIVGRQLDTLRTPDGRMIPGEFFPHFIKDFPTIRRFQVIQHTPDDVELKVICRGPWKSNDQETIIDEIQKLLGKAVRFRLSEVDEIPLTNAGKLRVVISHSHEPIREVN